MPRKLKLSFLNLTVTCGMWVFKEYNHLLMFAYMLEGICYNDMDKINKACVLFKKTNQSDSLLYEILQSYQRKNTTDILHSFKVFFRYQPEGLLITKY